MSATEDKVQQAKEAVRQMLEARAALHQANRADLAASAHLNSVLESLTEADDITPGWMMVPEAMTEKMIHAAEQQWFALDAPTPRGVIVTIWGAALGAVQFQPPKPTQDEWTCSHCGHVNRPQWRSCEKCAGWKL